MAEDGAIEALTPERLTAFRERGPPSEDYIFHKVAERAGVEPARRRLTARFVSNEMPSPSIGLALLEVDSMPGIEPGYSAWKAAA